MDNQDRTRKISLGIVIPVFNEAQTLPALVQRLREVFSPDACEREGIQRVSCVFVDDGSTDGSVSILKRLAERTLDAKIVCLSRNFGHQAALTAGLAQAAEYDVTAIIDADLQDPPEVILTMIGKWREGNDVVYGQRVNRKEGPIQVFCYWAFYQIYAWLSPIKVPVDSGDFCLLDRRVLGEMNRLSERLRFPRGLRVWVGFTQVGVPYDRPARVAGSTKYGFGDLYQLATDGIASMSIRPLQVAQVFSFSYFVLSLFAVVHFLWKSLFQDKRGQSSLIMAIMFFSHGITLFALYILGAYTGRMYLETKGRPNHIVRETLSFSRQAD